MTGILVALFVAFATLTLACPACFDSHVPSYPSCRPLASGLARIAGGTNIDVGLSRVRDRSPP